MTYNFIEEYDIIVIGAGHAGVEASLAASRMGCKVLLATINIEMLAFMPCNPSIGGSAKGIVVREVDALGGEMAKNIDKTYIQMKMLNTGKGPAVRALRAQADKELYSKEMRKTVENQENLTLRQTMIDEILVENGKVVEEGDVYDIFANPKEEITKKFINSSSALSNITKLIENKTIIPADSKLVKLTFTRDSVGNATISKISREYNVDVNIMLANVDVVNADVLGGIIASIEGTKENVQRAIDFLHESNVKVEVIHHA